MITLRLAVAARQPRAVGRSEHRTAHPEALIALGVVSLASLVEESLL